MLNANMSTTQALIGYPILGGLGGLGLSSMNKYYSQSLYGNSSNDPFIGSSWDFVLTGASIGGGAALVSAGIKYQAAHMRNSKIAEYTSQGLSRDSAKLLAMAGI